MLRKLISHFNRSVTKQIVAPRREFNVPIKVSITPNESTGKLSTPVSLSVRGETKDLSKTGIAFVVSAIRVKEYYLVGEDRILNAEIDLPNGKIQAQIVGQRYEQIGIHNSVSEFLIGAKITNMETEDREVYEDFLRLGGKATKKRVLQLNVE